MYICGIWFVSFYINKQINKKKGKLFKIVFTFVSYFCIVFLQSPQNLSFLLWCICVWNIVIGKDTDTHFLTTSIIKKKCWVREILIIQKDQKFRFGPKIWFQMMFCWIVN